MGRRARPGRIAPAAGAGVAGALGVGDGRAGGGAGAAGARRASAPTPSCCPSRPRPRSTRFRAPLSSIRDAERVIVVGDEPVEERAPVVALWIRAARRAGAEIVTVGAAGTNPTAPGKAAEAVRALGEQVRRRGADLVGPRRGRGRRRRRARRGARRGGRLLPARRPRTAARSSRPGTRRAMESRSRPRRSASSLISGDDAAADPGVQSLAERARRRDRDHDVRRPAARLGRPRPAGDELPGARRDDRQPRGPPAAPAPRGDPARAGRGRLDRQARPSASASRSTRTQRALAAEERAQLPAARASPQPVTAAEPRHGARAGRKGGPLRARPLPLALLRARRSSASTSSQFQRPEPRSSSPPATRAHAASPPATRSSSARTAPRVTLRARINKQLVARRRCAPPRSTSATLDQRVEVRRLTSARDAATEPWWIGLIKAVIFINCPADLDGVPDALRAKAARAACSGASARTAPARRAPPAVRRPDQDGAQGGVRAGRGDRHPLPDGAGLRSLHRAHRLQRDPLGRGLADLALPRERRDRRRADLADPDLRARLAGDLRVHHRRLGVRVEVLAARLDADVRADGLVRGLARARPCSASC